MKPIFKAMALLVAFTLSLPNPAYGLRTGQIGDTRETKKSPQLSGLEEALLDPKRLLDLASNTLGLSPTPSTPATVPSAAISPSPTAGLEERNSFFRLAKNHLEKSALFTKREIPEMLGRLRKLDEALDRWPVDLGGEPVSAIILRRNYPDSDAYSPVPVAMGSGCLIAFAPVFLGIKPAMELQMEKPFKKLAQLIQQGREASLWDLHFVLTIYKYKYGGGPRWVDYVDYSVGENLEDPKIRYERFEVIDRPTLLRAIDAIRDPEIRRYFENGQLRKAVEQGDWKPLSTGGKLKPGYHEIQGVKYGFPENSIWRTAASQRSGPRANVKDLQTPFPNVSSRWTGICAAERTTVNRWDASIELVADYLRYVRDAPVSFPPDNRILPPILPGDATGLEEGNLNRILPQVVGSIQGSGVVVFGSETSSRTGLEELVRRAPPELLMRMVFLVGAARAAQLQKLNPAVQVVPDNDVKKLAALLISLPEADRVTVLGTLLLAQQLQSLLPPVMAVSRLDPVVAFRLILADLGVPDSVLDQVDAAGLEESLARAQAA